MSFLVGSLKTLVLVPDLFTRSLLRVAPGSCQFHKCAVLQKTMDELFKEPKRWPTYNDVVYPPQKEGEPRRPAEVVHFRANIRCSEKKLWYISLMVRGMSIDEAIKQLSFHQKKGAQIVKEVLEEAQDLAVRDHNVEFRSNLWIADSFVGKAHTVKGVRKHAGLRYGTVHYRYSHYFVRLREGQPPEHYYEPPLTGNQKMEEYLEGLRKRTIVHSL